MCLLLSTFVVSFLFSLPSPFVSLVFKKAAAVAADTATAAVIIACGVAGFHSPALAVQSVAWRRQGASEKRANSH